MTDIPALVQEALASGDPSAWFDRLYAAADGDASAIPWAGLAPHPALAAWLDTADLDGVDAVVVGCGLGDDAAELARRGARVTAFDISPHAVRWAKERFGAEGVDWRVADLLDLPGDWRGAFGLVVDVRTVQSLPLDVRAAAMSGVASLVGEGGWLVACLHLATSAEAQAAFGGPPWPLAPSELADWAAAGLERIELAHPPHVDPAAEIMDVRTVWARRSDGLSER